MCPWKTRTHGSSRQRGKAFFLKEDPKIASRKHAIQRARVPRKEKSIKAVYILRAEGPTELCDRTFRKFASIADAEAQLSINARTAPEQGYNKHDFKVVFSDGTTYEGRYDLHLNESPSIVRQMRQYLSYMTNLAEDNPFKKYWTDKQQKDAESMLQKVKKL